MAFVTIDVLPNAEGSRHFDVVIKLGKRILATWSVGSEEEGRQQVLAHMEKINKKRNPDVS
jgi:hypothetical protein